MAYIVLLLRLWLVPPSRLPLLIAVVSVFLLVVLALLSTSTTVLNRRVLVRLLLVVAALSVAAEAALLVRLRGPAPRPYVAILPFLPGKESPQAWALSRTLCHNLRALSSNYYVGSFESVLEAVQADSVMDQAYVAKFCERSGLDAAVSGELVHHGEALQWSGHLWRQGVWSDTTLPASAGELEPLAKDAQAWLVRKLGLVPPRAEEREVYWDAQAAQADILTRAAKFEEARRVLSNAHPPLHWLMVGQSYLQQAKQLRNLGRAWREPLYHAVTTAEELVQQDSTLVEAHLLLGECHILEEEWDRAETHVRKALALDPSSSHALVLLMRLHRSRYRDLGFEDEEQLYRRAIWYDPCSVSARLGLVAYLQQMGRRSEALQAVDEVLRINPSSIPGLLAKGRMLITWEQNEAGFACLEKAASLAPDDPEVLFAFGVARYVTEDYEGARPLFERAVAVGDHLDSYLYLGLIARRLGQPEKALPYFQERVRRKRDAQDRLAEIARENIFQITH
ncbi:MAG: tetratricopeptide repeat protein [candidate division KSB1 bacterium]|jgi:tetratricopeptide (TPR) repeat protein|nr:tetratricopeptide repeat protein [candidate division KSB1 bacterium]